MTTLFDSTTTVKAELSKQKYIASDEIATIVYLSQKLEKPLLAEGPAGVGKTELAKAIASATGRELIRLQCYEGLDESKALYEWEYSKQLLYTQLLRDKLNDTLGKAESLAEAADKLANEEDVFFSNRFLLQRPLLKAILSDKPTVLLIDEIDRADAEFEAFLLEILSDFQVSVPELGTLTAKHKPFVVLTSNNTRELSEALKRRCLYLFIDYPNLQEELAVVRLKVPDLNPKLAQQAVEFVQKLRKADMRKSPSISETLDWANALVALNASNLDKDVLEDTLSVLLKHEADLQKAKRQLMSPPPQQQKPREITMKTLEGFLEINFCVGARFPRPVFIGRGDPAPTRNVHYGIPNLTVNCSVACQRGARVSGGIAEAFSAVDLMGIQNREEFRLSLRATLIKDLKDIATFDKLFPLFFGSGQPPMMGGNPSDDMTPEEAQMLAEALRQFAENLRQRMERLMSGDQLSRAELEALGQLSRIESGGQSQLSKLDGAAHDACDGVP
jgi:MoxR-like ATPase